MTENERKQPGPKEDRIKVEVAWEDAVKDALRGNPPLRIGQKMTHSNRLKSDPSRCNNEDFVYDLNQISRFAIS